MVQKRFLPVYHFHLSYSRSTRNHATYRDKHSLEPRVVDELPVGVSGLADLEGVGLGQRGDVDDPVAAARREEEARVGAVGAAAARRSCRRPTLRHELSMRGNCGIGGMLVRFST